MLYIVKHVSKKYINIGEQESNQELASLYFVLSDLPRRENIFYYEFNFT